MIDLGETWSSPWYQVRDAAGVLANAGTVTATITLPDGTTASPSVSNPSTGQYTVDFLTSQAGRHLVLLSATGGILGSFIRRITDEFNVAKADPLAIVSLQQAKDHLNKSGLQTTDDEELRLMVASATALIEETTGPVVRRTFTERVTLRWGQWSFQLTKHPVISLTSVTGVSIGSVSPAVGQLDVDTDTGLVRWLNPTAWFTGGTYNVTYVAGRNVVPEGLQLAALHYIKGSWETQRGGSGLPLQGSPDELVNEPSMGLVMWRLKQELRPYDNTAVVA